MSYPSLLFSEKAAGRRIAEHVFEDVKLNAFFSEDSIGAMRALCRREDIPVRQDLLRFLDGSSELRRTLEELSGITVELLRLHDALQDVKCENERHYVFVGLMAAVADFVLLAASLPVAGGPLLQRFGSRFRADCADHTRAAMYEKAQELRGLEAGTIRIASFNVNEYWWNNHNTSCESYKCIK